MQIFGVIPFIKLYKTKQLLNSEQCDVELRYLAAFD